MNKYLAAACGAALVATAGLAAAQSPTPDRKGGEQSTQSANPDMDKKKQQNKNGGKGPVTQNPTPGTDSPGSESSTDSAKKKRQ